MYRGGEGPPPPPVVGVDGGGVRVGMARRWGQIGLTVRRMVDDSLSPPPPPHLSLSL